MSGGSLDYFYSEMQSHVGDFKDKELDDLVYDMADLFYKREWFLSGDTNEGSWVEARDKFKDKWFTKHGREERIEKYLEEIKDEVFKSLGMSNKYCKNCIHWFHCKEKDYDEYGQCDLNKNCLMHRSETCERCTTSITHHLAQGLEVEACGNEPGVD